jgi:hypothetical protein
LSFSVWNERARLETLELIGEQSAGLRSFALYHDEYRPDVLDRNVLNAIVGTLELLEGNFNRFHEHMKRAWQKKSPAGGVH